MEEENHFEHVKKYFEKLVLVILESRIPDEKQTKCENVLYKLFLYLKLNINKTLTKI